MPRPLASIIDASVCSTVPDSALFLESYAPFQCMEARESFLIVDKQLAAAPGPAHYTPALEEHVKGGDSLMSKVIDMP